VAYLTFQKRRKGTVGHILHLLDGAIEVRSAASFGVGLDLQQLGMDVCTPKHTPIWSNKNPFPNNRRTLIMTADSANSEVPESKKYIYYNRRR